MQTFLRKTVPNEISIHKLITMMQHSGWNVSLIESGGTSVKSIVRQSGSATYRFLAAKMTLSRSEVEAMRRQLMLDVTSGVPDAKFWKYL